MKKQQFTLIEMLVVIAIIAVLATMIGTAIVSMKEKGNKTTCLSNLKNLHAAIMQYESNNNGMSPFINASTVTNGGGKHEDLLYLIRKTEAGDDPNLYKCPSATNTIVGSSKARGELSTTRSDADFSAKNNSYAYFMGKVDGNAVGVTMNNASGIVADGWSGGTDINSVEDDGWNHKGAGNWFTKGGSGKQAEAEKWPDQVKGTPDANWNAFKLW